MAGLSVVALLGAGCRQQSAPEATPGLEERLNGQLPPHFPPLPASPERNPLTKAGVALGEKLFFDPLLSASNKLSCASCHQPALAFTDGVALASNGHSGQPLNRHSPTLVNLAWATEGLFWDGGARDLESQAFGPLTHPDEMASDLKQLVTELQNHATYPALFKKAFGTDTIYSAYVARALAQYQRTLLSVNSKYDRYRQGIELLDSLELQGLRLFRQHCSGCHPEPLFTDHRFHNNGLENTWPMDFENEAQGRYRVTLQPEDLGKFKTPSLRNVAVTAPYMHDGRFATLQEVLQHYTARVKPSSTLSPWLQHAKGSGIPLSWPEQQAITHFLHTLTDSSFSAMPAAEPL